jgi:cell fate (sporulation/competence/biofilm development) regulator YlbF (YheA/YmcA/DUF963 family)
MNPNQHTMTTTDERIVEAARKFGRTIGESKVYKNFEAAHQSLRGDQEAQQLLQQYQQSQQQLQMMQSWGGAQQDDIQRLEDMRKQMMENETLKEFFRAQDELVAQLKELNQFMTDKLGFDFADMTKPAGGCC